MIGNVDINSERLQEIYVRSLMTDPKMVELFGEDGFELEDSGGVMTSKEYSLASTVVAMGSTRGNVASEPASGSTRMRPSGGTVVRVYQIGIIVYVADKVRSAKKKRKLVDLTETIVEVIESLKFTRDPIPTRGAWYISELLQPICTRYRKADNHQQSITFVNLYSRRRTI